MARKHTPELLPVSKSNRVPSENKRPPRRRLELSPSEEANCTRLVALLREKDYWVGAFIEWLLQRNRSESVVLGTDVDAVERMLKDIKGLESWANWMDRNPIETSPLRKYFAVRFFPDAAVHRACDLRGAVDDGTEYEFDKLVATWRETYPPPPKTVRQPAGHLDRKDEDDSSDEE